MGLKSRFSRQQGDNVEQIKAVHGTNVCANPDSKPLVKPVKTALVFLEQFLGVNYVWMRFQPVHAQIIAKIKDCSVL